MPISHVSVGPERDQMIVRSGPMKLGVIVPQGWTGEYDGWETSARGIAPWPLRSRRIGSGFESIWLFDHFHTVPRPTDEITFESFTSLPPSRP